MQKSTNNYFWLLRISQRERERVISARRVLNLPQFYLKHHFYGAFCIFKYV